MRARSVSCGACFLRSYFSTSIGASFHSRITHGRSLWPSTRSVDARSAFACARAASSAAGARPVAASRAAAAAAIRMRMNMGESIAADERIAARMTARLELDGASLTLEDLVAVADGGTGAVLAEVAARRVDAARAVIDRAVAEDRVVYGVTTG